MENVLDELIAPEQENRRLEKLHKYEILDTPPDGSFDRIAELASNLLNVPIAIVSLVDKDRIWFKSAHGLDVRQIDREPGLCASAILKRELYVVADAVSDVRTLSNSLVAGQFGLRFYAAAPLTTSDGYNLGTLCVIDKKPREISETEKKTLQNLAAVVMDQIELRLAARIAVNSNNKMAYLITHDVKGALVNIPSLIEIIKTSRDNPDDFSEACEMITYSANKSLNAIDSFLKYANTLGKEIEFNPAPLDFSALVKKVVLTNQILAQNKQQVLQSKIEENLWVSGDEARLTELTDNLVNNAVKYTYPGKAINVSLKKVRDEVVFEVRDEGQGLSEADISNAFKRFARLSARPTGNELSNGLGLWIVKELADKHHGMVSVASEGKDKGATFTLRLPTL